MTNFMPSVPRVVKRSEGNATFKFCLQILFSEVFLQVPLSSD